MLDGPGQPGRGRAFSVGYCEATPWLPVITPYLGVCITGLCTHLLEDGGLLGDLAVRLSAGRVCDQTSHLRTSPEGFLSRSVRGSRK